MKKTMFSMLAVITILFASCAGSKNTTGNKDSDFTEITGKRWQLVELGGKPVAEKINGKMPTLDFMNDGSRFSANGGCNMLGGEFLFGGLGKITFKTGMSTMMACENMEIETGLKDVFAKTNSYILSGDELTLAQGRKAHLAKFRAINASNELVGTWELDYIDSKGASFDSLYPEKKPTLIFEAGSNKVHGNGGCNNFNSTVEIHGRNINFGPVASTRMACPGEGEPLFFQSLDKVNVQSVNGDNLTLIVGDIAIMRFKKVK